MIENLLCYVAGGFTTAWIMTLSQLLAAQRRKGSK